MKKILALFVIASLAFGCASASFNPETNESSVWVFGQSTATASSSGVDAEGGALSDGLTAFLAGLAQAIAGVLGSGPPPIVNVTVPGAEVDGENTQ